MIIVWKIKTLAIVKVNFRIYYVLLCIFVKKFRQLAEIKYFCRKAGKFSSKGSPTLSKNYKHKHDTILSFLSANNPDLSKTSDFAER